jgi:hypothetical protein
MPEPQPISCGNISQGMPLRRTNTIPLKQARSDNLGLPPLGFGIGGGNRDLIKSHRLSGISAAALINVPSLSSNYFCVESCIRKNRRWADCLPIACYFNYLKPNWNPMELPSFSWIWWTYVLLVERRAF